jgi:hypothetical protein
MSGSTWVAGGNGAGGWGFSSLSGSQYQDLCTAPCELSMAAGEYRVGVSQGGGTVREIYEPLVLHGPTTLHLEYESRLGYRIAGWGLFFGGMIGGGAMIGASRSEPRVVNTFDSAGRPTTERVETKDETLQAGGIAVAVVSVVGGLALALLQDHRAVRPQASPRPAMGVRVKLGGAGVAGSF